MVSLSSGCTYLHLGFQAQLNPLWQALQTFTILFCCPFESWEKSELWPFLQPWGWNWKNTELFKRTWCWTFILNDNTGSHRKVFILSVSVFNMVSQSSKVVKWNLKEGAIWMHIMFILYMLLNFIFSSSIEVTLGTPVYSSYFCISCRRDLRFEIWDLCISRQTSVISTYLC